MGRTALHWCVVHGNDEMMKIICEYLKEGVGDSMRVTRFLDAQTLDGETALMLAARQRSGLMCYALTQIGANPNMRNNKGRTAAYLARQHNWSEIADWLEKKVGAGMSKVETFSDLQFEKQHRFGHIKVQDLIHNFGRTYLLLMQNRIGLHPLGCPFNAKNSVAERGNKAIAEQKKFMDAHQLYIQKRDPFEYQTGKKTAEDPEEHQHLKEMRQYVTQMVDLLRAGTTNPNTELEPKPLAWTPLMCAVAVNDIRSIKLMIREGANPNHPNRDGTTAVMVAAQLQNVEALAELLMHKGDIEAIDSQGYNVASYATSLPLPTVMERDTVGVIMEGDTDGPRPMTSMELLKIVMMGGLQDIKTIMAEREAASKPEALDLHFRVMQLLHKYGLSAIHSERNVHDSVKSSEWRVKEPDLFTHKVDVEKEEMERERRNKILYERMKNKAPPQKSADELSLEDLRCPVCTLQVPCAHFFKIEILKQFLQKKIEAAKLAAAGEEAAAAAAAAEGKRPKKRFISAKKLRIANRAQEILTEAHIADRNTDRSTLLMQQYRGREIEVWEEQQRRKQQLIEATRQAEEEEALRLGDTGEGEFDEEEVEVDEHEAERLGLLEDGEEEKPALQIEAADATDQGAGVTAHKTDDGTEETEEARPSTMQMGVPESIENVASRPTGSKLRSVKRLPSKQDLAATPDEGAARLVSPPPESVPADSREEEAAAAAAFGGADLSVALVPIPEESSAPSSGDGTPSITPPPEQQQLVVVGETEERNESPALLEGGEGSQGSQALVVVPPVEEAFALVPVLKSALKTAETDLNSALVEFKKKRRVKFYFSDDQDASAPLAITDGSEVQRELPTMALVLSAAGGGQSDLDAFGAMVGAEDASLSSDSTASSTGDGTGPLLITAGQVRAGQQVQAPTAKLAGIALTASGEFPNPAEADTDPFADIATVSTSTTLTSTDDSSLPDGTAATKPTLTKSASDGLASLQQGELPDFMKASTLVNPVPLHNRRVFMFTRNPMDRKGRTDGLIHVPEAQQPAPPTAATGAGAVAPTTPAASATTGAVVPALPPSGKRKVKVKALSKDGKRAPRRFVPSAPIKVDVSGWIFVSLADIKSEVNPLDNVSISLVSWANMMFCCNCRLENLLEEQSERVNLLNYPHA